MDTPTENSPETEIIVPDSSNTTSTSQLSVHDVPLAEIQSKAPATEETLILLQRQRVSVSDFPTFIDEISRERDSLRGKVDEFEASLREKEDEFAKKSEEELKKAEKLENQVEVSREIIQKLETEIEDRKHLFLDFIRKSKTSLKRIIESVDEDEEENVEVVSVEPASVAGVGIEEEEEIMETRRVALEAEEKVAKYKEKWKKEKRELEKSVVSLTEENRDINSLLRAALVEKEAVEKSLSKLKGINNNEQRRVALLQIAERGLQRVGFGFMMGAGTTTTSSSEQQPQTGSDTSECEEEEINDSLASTVERIMKNLRQEITKLRRSLEESRSDTDNLNNWNRGDPCTSNWTGIGCFNEKFDDGFLHVQQLMLLNMNLFGSLSPELGNLSNMTILDFMWNNISGSIPKEIGNITSLELLLLNGNQLTGSLPEELGFLQNLNRIQIDQNHISGPIPVSFSKLNKAMHFHMNNNSISGQIPPELSRLPRLVHFLLDNNNLSGYLPPEFSQMPRLQILQLDNNRFDGNTIPVSYSNMSKLLKLSLRNCNLQGTIPDLSQIPNLYYLDLSSNKLNGSIPPGRLSENITTIYLSNNNLTGPVPENFSGLPHLQKLSIANNSLSGSISSTIWTNRSLNETESLIVLEGNPLCSETNLVQFCRFESENKINSESLTNTTSVCQPQRCPPPYENSPPSPELCFCAAPLLVGYRLKSPGFSNFLPYRYKFEEFLTSTLKFFNFQLYIDSFAWEEGPRLGMHLKLFPVYNTNIYNPNIFNTSEVRRILHTFVSWEIHDPDIFGPYEVLNFTLLDVYKDVIATSPRSALSKGALVGIVLGTIAGAVTLSVVVSLLTLRAHRRNHPAISRRRHPSKASMKIDGVKPFTYGEMAMATNNFNSSTQVGQGGFGKVYKGILTDGTVVAIKRAQEGSLQGEKEFLTEIEFLSRLHHRNLLSLIGYCDEEYEQMLVYEFMPNGTLRDHLSAKSKEPLSFAMRLRIALGSAKGILYLHTEADPPIFHRDIKASNILLDLKYTAKVADFGLSRLAPVPDIEGTVPAHISTVVKGTPGYLDPEYFLTHKLTDKSDVYSLGIVFLELLTGMQPISHGKNIVREVNVAYKSGIIFSIIDERMGSFPSDCVVKFLNLALKCCQDETDARPSMAEVVRELESLCNLMPDSDTIMAYPMDTDTVKVVSLQSSSSAVENPYVSSDVSGSNLVSGVVPSITPR